MITQAQIGAACKAMADTESGFVRAEHYVALAKAALTAAAQVGEPTEDRMAQKIIEPIIKDAITTAVNLTIERCAQVAESIKCRPNETMDAHGAIDLAAAAIRNLKDAP